MPLIDLSEEACRMLCGLVHPSDSVTGEAWEELRETFPFASYYDPEEVSD